MKIGTVFPQTELASASEIRDYAQAIEGLGYARTVVYDHVLGAGLDTRPDFNGPFSINDSFHEVFVLLTFIAAHTERLRLSTGVLVLPQRQTALVARQAAELDLLSGGRVDLGVGVGWNQIEYDALGSSFRDRGRRFEEQIEVMRQLWTQKTVTFDGAFHHIADAGLNPRPVQRPIPVLIGVSKDALLERVARLGDGWIPFPTRAHEAAKQLEQLTIELSAKGKSIEDFPIQARMILREHDRDNWADEIQAWHALGVSDLSLGTSRLGLESVDGHVALLTELAGELNLGSDGVRS